MRAFVYLMCIVVASFATLAQPTVAQGASTTLPLIYPGQVLQGDGSQTCPSDEQCEMLRKEIENAAQTLDSESQYYPSCKATLVVGQLAGDV